MRQESRAADPHAIRCAESVQLLEPLQRTEPVSILISGEPGMGKTTLFDTALDYLGSRGVPFYIRELAEEVARQQVPSESDGSDVASLLPESIRDATSARLNRLPNSVQEQLFIVALGESSSDSRIWKLLRVIRMRCLSPGSCGASMKRTSSSGTACCAMPFEPRFRGRRTGSCTGVSPSTCTAAAQSRRSLPSTNSRRVTAMRRGKGF